MNQKIRLEDHGYWASIIVDRPEAKNAIDRASMAQLHSIIEALNTREDLALLAIRGADDVFIAGGDIKDLAAIKDAKTAEAMSKQMNEILEALGQLNCLTVAAINGDSYGGGCELAFACDVRILDSNSKLYFKQAAMGLTPGWGGGQRLAKLIGPGRATMLYVTGAALDASTALAMGIVDFVESDVETKVIEWAAQMKKFSPLAIRSTKRAIREGYNLESSEAFELERRLFGLTWASEGHEQAVDRFINKRR